ncbi:glycosyltransferase [Paenibacillus sp. sgz500958]|uniref:glycosyltransferase family 2 protein n=1 Tax=Paenibacillus sp. sgz500958 TaxID=3242475 RepID=UPI0036D40815
MNSWSAWFYKLYSLLIRAKIKKYIITEFITGNKGYQAWIARHETALDHPVTFHYSPLISIIMPVYNVKEEYLRECIDSVIQQQYPHWELCIADDHSSMPHVRKVLDEYAKADSRIKVVYRTFNGHISACSNSALQIVEGEFAALLDNDDTLAPFALYEVVKLLNNDPNADLIFSDEDKLLNGQRCFPFYKRAYGPGLLRQINYICHLAVYRTSLLHEVNGFREGYEGVQDWDLALRVMAKSDRVKHIPKILYHWRITETSTAGGEHRKSYVKEARRRMLQNSDIKR